MVLKDVSRYGLYRTLLVVNIVLPLFIIPVFVIANLVDPEAVHINIEEIKFLSMTITMDLSRAVFYPVVVLLYLINALIVSSFQAILVKALAKYTPIGKIQLSGRLSDYNREVFS